MDTKLSAIILTYTVGTVHGDYLESVLDQASWRNDDKSYYQLLVECVKHELAQLGCDAEFCEWDAYYTMTVDILIRDITTIPSILPAIERAVKTWTNKYNISQMSA